MGRKIIPATGHAHAFHRASVLAAINNGYFREEGLPDVELTYALSTQFFLFTDRGQFGVSKTGVAGRPVKS